MIQYRGYPISELVGKTKFEDTAFLLIWGHLPSAEERLKFSNDLRAVPLPDQSVFDVIRALPYVTKCSDLCSPCWPSVDLIY
jgi:citrate synthase